MNSGLSASPRADSLARNDVHERAALRAGEHCLVDGLRILLLAEDQAAARAAQRLVRRRGHNVRPLHRVRVITGSDKAGNVRHVHHEQRTAVIADFAEFLEINHARVGAGTGHDELRLHLHGLIVQLLVINVALGVHAVGDKIVIFAGHVHRGTMGEMAALGKVHAHDRVAGLEQGKVHRHVGLRARMGLHIGVFRTKQAAGAVAGNVLHHVDIFAAAVVALARVTFRIFVREDAAHGGHHGGRNKVFGSDQLQIAALAAQLVCHGGADLRICAADKADRVHHILIHVTDSPSLFSVGFRPQCGTAHRRAAGREGGCPPVFD